MKAVSYGPSWLRNFGTTEKQDRSSDEVTKRIRKIRHRDQLNAILESARASEKSPQRKHHVVPSSYLRRWEHDGSLWVTDLIERRTYRGSAQKAARETDFYRVNGAGVDSEKLPPLVVETVLSAIEGVAVTAIDNLIKLADGQPVELGDRFTVANFLAVQIVRGRRFRATFERRAAGAFRSTMGDINPDIIRKRFGPNLPEDQVAAYLDFYKRILMGDVRVVPTRTTSIAMAVTLIDDVAYPLFQRHWAVYRSPAPLVTSDEPVVLLGGRKMPRGATSGVATAGVVLFPLDPHHLLVMFDPGLTLGDEALDSTLTTDETAQINLEIIATAHRMGVSKGELVQAPRVPVLPPRVVEAVVEGEVPIVNLVGHTAIHTFSPSPWLYAPNHHRSTGNG